MSRLTVQPSCFRIRKLAGLFGYKNWRYPVVCDVSSGKVEFDNFEGRWGDRSKLDQFLQAYAVERAMIEARKDGHSVTEQQLTDGSVKLTIDVGGAQ